MVGMCVKGRRWESQCGGRGGEEGGAHSPTTPLRCPPWVFVQKCVSTTARWTMVAVHIIAWKRKASATVAALKVTSCGTTTCSASPKVSP